MKEFSANKRKLFIISNSQGTDLGVQKGDNYPILVQKYFRDNFETGLLLRSGWSVINFCNHIEDICQLKPNLVIIQIGIIDCAKRILSEKEKFLLSFIPHGKKITKFLHKNNAQVIRIREKLSVTTRVVPEKEFEKRLTCLLTFLNKFNIRYFLIDIPILPSNCPYNILINKDIVQYNNIMKRFGSKTMIYKSDNLEKIFQSGPGIVHFSKFGHRLIADRICKFIPREKF